MLQRLAAPAKRHVFARSLSSRPVSAFRPSPLFGAVAGRSRTIPGSFPTSFGFAFQRRGFSSEKLNQQNTNVAIYLIAFGVGMIGMTYAAVPLYQMFCQAYGLVGTVQLDSKLEKLNKWKSNPEASTERREISVTFEANTNFNMDWTFKPTQRQLKVVVGETALAFFTATNNAKTPVVGVATYNVTPMRAGLFFNKIQCFCFDEQRLRAGETVDMPVFFYIDPEMLNDPKMHDMREICLSYTFFPSSDWNEDDEEEEVGEALPAVTPASSITAR